MDGNHKLVNIRGAQANGAPLNKPSAFGPVNLQPNGRLRYSHMEKFREWREKQSKKDERTEAARRITSECQNRFRVLLEKGQTKKHLKGVFSSVCRHLISSPETMTVIDTVSEVF